MNCAIQDKWLTYCTLNYNYMCISIPANNSIMYKFMNTQISIYIQDLAMTHWITSTYQLF